MRPARARGTAAVLAVVVVGIAAGWTLVRPLPAWGLAAEPVYSVGQLREDLALHARAWLGRTVWVYAVAEHVGVRYCPYPEDACVGEVPVLASTGAPRAASLPLVWGLSDPLRAWLRRLPLLAGLVPPQVPHWGRPATYRIALRALPGPPWHAGDAGGAGDAAVLLDASPVEGF